jgi:hypothetical protein
MLFMLQDLIFWVPKYLTLSVRAEYIYSAACQATSPDGVYILRGLSSHQSGRSIYTPRFP